jgi:hypothetical protein
MEGPDAEEVLNMVEIEFSVLSRQCTSRRIPSLDDLQIATTA